MPENLTPSPHPRATPVTLYAADGSEAGAGATPADAGDTGSSALNSLFNGTTWDRQRTPTIFKNLSAVVVTSETAIWTPATGKKFRIMGYHFTTGVLTGALVLRDGTAGSTILVIPQSTIGVSFLSPDLGNGILSGLADRVLTAQGTTTETVTGYIFGTEE